MEFHILTFRVPDSQTVACGSIRSGKSYTVSKALTSREPRGRPLKDVNRGSIYVARKKTKKRRFHPKIKTVGFPAFLS